jgi:hypothetical protein
MPSLGTAITMRLSVERSKLSVIPVGLPLPSTARAVTMPGGLAAVGELAAAGELAAIGELVGDTLATDCAGTWLAALCADEEGAELPQATTARAAAATAAPRHLSTVMTG